MSRRPEYHSRATGLVWRRRGSAPGAGVEVVFNLYSDAGAGFADHVRHLLEGDTAAV